MGADVPLVLGAFELTAPLRRGGMAEVWRGIHRREGAPVAIKLVTERRARTRHLREALQNEVRAMARLDDESIVRVHDYGEVPAEVAAASEGRLVPASPYLVMELAEGGTLGPKHVTSWPELVGVLSSVLSGLAHAHARGVVHRDIKPSNVLVAGSIFKLSDFGIAHALGVRAQGEPTAPLSAGTAWFMAPEQILGLHRDEGPWTDLYAVGCLAHLLACGTLPFPGVDRELVYRAHCLAAPPRLAPRFTVPSDFEAWVHVLLAKRPRDRFALAADALRSLRSLAGAPLAPTPSSELALEPAVTWAAPGDTSAPTSAAVPPLVGSHDRTETAIQESSRPVDLAVDDVDDAVRRRADALRVELPFELPPFAQIEAERAFTLLTGIGLGVYGLKPVPLTGREPLCAELWTTLREAWESGTPRIVELRGRAGLGKTRLAEWLVERVTETGAATALWTGLGPTPSLSEGLPRMIARHLRVEGLSRGEVEERLWHHPTEPALDALDDAERARLVDLLAPAALAVTRPEERFAVALRLMSAIGARRPLVLVFDDAQLGREPIELAHHLARLRGGRLPALVVLTVQEEALEERAEEAAQLDALAAQERCRRIELGPLDPADHARLVHSMLGLERGLAREIAKRTAGNPLFAIQLVGDWVQRGELVLSAHGFALREGASLDLPDDIHELWSGRLSRLFASLEPGTRETAATVLELAALLGRQVELAEWEEACTFAGVAIPEGFLDALASRRLAMVGRARFSFVHGMLAESLSRRARESGRWGDLHRACAYALATGEVASGRSERIGRHLAAAGEGLEAAPLLWAAAKERLAICDYAEAHALCALRDEGLAAAGVEAGDPSRAHGVLLRAEAAVSQGRLEDCSRFMQRVTSLAPTDEHVLAELAQLRGRIALKRAQNEESAAAYSEALTRMRRVGDRAGEAHALHGLGDAEKLLGMIDESLRHYEAAVVLFDELEMVVEAARVRMGVADVVRRRGELDRAAAIIEGSLPIIRRMNNRHALAVALNTLGDIARARGDLAGAEAYYAEAYAELSALGSGEASIIHLNLGLTQIERERWEEAARTFALARRELAESGRRGYLVFALAGLWACAAAARTWGYYDAITREITALTAEVAVVDDDLGFLFDRTTRVVVAAGERERAAPALELATAQWRALERHDEARALEAAARAE